MENLTFPWPQSQGEWLASASAAATVLLGLVFLLAPRIGLRLRRLKAAADYPGAFAAARGPMAGFCLGVGLSAIFFDQPFVWMTLGFGWLFTAFGRLVSITSDRGAALHNALWLIVEVVLGALPLAFAFGFVA